MNLLPLHNADTRRDEIINIHNVERLILPGPGANKNETDIFKVIFKSGSIARYVCEYDTKSSRDPKIFKLLRDIDINNFWDLVAQET
jgi:hypothetical protein